LADARLAKITPGRNAGEEHAGTQGAEEPRRTQCPHRGGRAGDRLLRDWVDRFWLRNSGYEYRDDSRFFPSFWHASGQNLNP